MPAVATVRWRSGCGDRVPPIEGRAGWLVRNALRGPARRRWVRRRRYRLDVRLDDRLEGLGVLGDDTIGRERRTLRARYQLVDLASGAILLDATAGSDAGIDVVSSPNMPPSLLNRPRWKTSPSEVADRIVTQLALTLRNRAAAGQ